MKSYPTLRLVVATSLALALHSEAVTLNVPGQYPTIQSAINAAQAGDEVHVGDGTYAENVIINKEIILSGHWDSTQIVATGAVPAIAIAADNVLITDIGVTTTGAPSIYAEGQSNVIVYGADVTGGPIRLVNSRGASIVNCNVNSPVTDGIETVGNGSLGGAPDEISNCQISASAEGTATGIAVRDAMLPVSVYRNVVWDTLRGIEVSGPSETTVNVFENYVHSSYSGSQPLLFASGPSNDGAVEFTCNNINTLTAGMPDINATGLTLECESGRTLAVTGHYNRIVAAKAVTQTGTGTCTLDLANNWWGRNSNINSDVSVSPWLTMRVSPLSATVAPGEFVTINVDWFINSDDEDVSTEGSLAANEDGNFQADAGYFFDPSCGTRIPLTVYGGYTSADFYPDGASTVTVNLDYESIAVLCNQ